MGEGGVEFMPNRGKVKCEVYMDEESMDIVIDCGKRKLVIGRWYSYGATPHFSEVTATGGKSG